MAVSTSARTASFTAHLPPAFVRIVDETKFEADIAAGQFAGVIDANLADLLTVAHIDRLTAAARAGIPQVVLPGGLDRASCRDLDRIGRDIAHKLSASPAPAGVLVPSESWADDGPVTGEQVRIFVESLRLWLLPRVKVEVVPAWWGDELLAARAAELIASWVGYPTYR